MARITFIGLGGENMGISQLSSYLQTKGHTATLVFDPALFADKQILNFKNISKLLFPNKKLIKKVLDSKPDVIGFSVFTNSYQWALDLSIQLKKHTNVPIVFGGIHATSVPEELIKEDSIDYVVIGEGEIALLELIKVIEKKEDIKNLKNTYYKRDGEICFNGLYPLIQNLDNLPLLDKDLFEPYIPIKEGYFIMSSRGCPHSCPFCSNNLINKLYSKDKFLRRRSVEHVIDELKIARKKFDIKFVFFLDNIFTMDEVWLRKFCDMYKKEIDIPFRCVTHPRFSPENVLLMLKNAGCQHVEIGMETYDDNNRKHILKRYETTDEIRKIILTCKEIGLHCSIDYMFFPWEGENIQISAARFFNQVRPDKIATFYLSYLPKTEIIKYAKKHGFIDEEKEGLINAGISENLYHSGGDISKKQLKICRQFDILLQLTNVLSKGQLDFIINKKLYKVFHLIHPILFIAMKDLFYLPVRKGYVDHAHRHLAIYYLKNIKRMIVTRQYF